LTRFRLRTNAHLLVAVVGHIVLISLQANTASGARVFEGVTLGVFSEVQRSVTSSVDAVVGFWDDYVGLLSVQSENDALRSDLADLQFRYQRERALARRARSLEELLEFRRGFEIATVSARVIAGDATPYFRTVTIDRGTGSGVRRDSAVVSPEGVVGRVVGDPGPRASKVQLLVDRSAAAGALIERTRVAGLVMGDVDEGLLRMEYVSNLEDVQLGDVVITSGGDGVYPKGFVLGDVEFVEREVGLYQTIYVRPRVEFNDLENVLVIVDDSPTSGSAAGDE